MAEDLNAAVRGAIEAGATDILVNDSHGGQRNLLPEDVHPARRLISHSFKRHGMMEGLDETFDGAIFIGYHAKADAPRGLFAHTGSGVVRDLQINGRSVGEGGMNAALAAWHGVPVLVVTGDDVAVAEVKESAPDARGVVVKRAINIRAVELAAVGESADGDPARRPRGRGRRQEAVAAAQRSVPRADALPQLRDSRGAHGVQGSRTGGARHDRVYARDDAGRVSPDSRVLPVHQRRLIPFMSVARV